MTLALLALFAALAILGCCVAGCSPKTASEVPATPKRFVVVLLDLSGSTLPYRAEYVADFERIASSLEYGDQLAVLSVDQNSVQNSALLIDYTMPSFVKDDKRQKSDYMVEQARKKWERENPRESFREGIVATATPAILNTQTSGSDLVGALEVAGRMFSAKPESKKSLVIFSDMVLRGTAGKTEIDLGKPKADFAKAYDALKANGMIPGLKDVKVTVVGAVTNDSTRWHQIRDFWAKVFADAGATMPLERYNRNLTNDQAKDL